ncbi:signal recognition particle-docking protein FtsY [Neptunomonas phycophila]|uniref:signal recognition particle-docking protein FtsY n=1 Tax=Neptunomonas phycophila TaxID=1572645 RepID=UPI001BE94099|nr:signal recognition particle-docking protein FtsY [Neptunomonas phycophila]MBT3146125.1 signal recognition particle-docking protein FtsY [Neptunomonas phycophila]
MFKKLKSIFSSNEDKQDVNESDVQQGEVVSVETADKLPENKVDEASQSSEQVNDTIQSKLSEESTEVVHDAAAAINDELPVSAKEPVSAPQDIQAESAQEPDVTEVQTQLEADKAPEPVVIDMPAATPAVLTDEAPQKKGMFARIKAGLSRTKANLTEQLGTLFLGKKEIDDELLEDIETLLLTSDVGVEATTDIIDRLTSRVQRNQLADAQALHQALKDELAGLLGDVEQPLVAQAENAPYVILMVGVNGVGKTTTIGKLTKRFQSEGKSVMLAAGDTFRAAAVEQLQVWGERNNVPVIAQHTGADSASVLFDAVQSAKAKSIDVLIADTAGRLQNKDHLMEELEKVVRVMRKIDPAAPHEVMLVLDAGTGQNAMSQAKIFQEAVGVTGITLTKLDGTAKGGIIFAIAKQLKLPIRFIGVGEQVDDLRPFKADEFVEALFDE